MKKYISTILASVLITVVHVSAMTPPPGGWEAPLTTQNHSILSEIISTMSPFALLFIISSQIFFIWCIVRELIKIYVLKTVQLTLTQRIFVATFSLVYLLCIIVTILNFILLVFGYN